MIVDKHPMYRPEAATLISNLIRLNPENLEQQTSMEIKVLLVKTLVDMIWSGHPTTTAAPPDGVAFDVLKFMSNPSSFQMHTAAVKNTFKLELSKSVAAPYSPGFSRELGTFLFSNHSRPNPHEFDEYQKNFFRRFLPDCPF